MTEPSTVSLDEVRERFLEAEVRLGDAATAIRAIEDAAIRVGAARESLTSAGDEIRGLAGQFGNVASSLTENAEELRRGVDAIRLGDPAEVRRQIGELDASFSAMQSVLSERFGSLEAGQAAAAESARAARTETRIIGALTAILLIVTIVILLVR